MKKLILITGVAGFIGSEVARRFCEEGFEVVGVDDLSSGKINRVPKGIDFIKADLSNRKAIHLLPNKCSQILHLAGQSSGEISFDNPVGDLKKNTVSTLNLIDYGIKKKADRLIYASSMSVYGKLLKKKATERDSCKPLSCYGIGKLMSENYLNIFRKKLPYISLRMFNVYGPGQNMENLKQGMISIYLAQALKNKKIMIKGSLNRVRDFIFIKDVVEIWFRASQYNLSMNQIINVGSGIPTKVKKVIEIIKKKINGTKHFISNGTVGDQYFVCSDNKILKKKLRFNKFISLEDGLETFISSLKR